MNAPIKNLIKKIVVQKSVSKTIIWMWSILIHQEGKKRFEYLGQELQYFIHTYNNIFSWGYSERSIEIPIILHLLKIGPPPSLAGPLRILEIGNVTKHYYDLFKTVERVVLDKYEKAYDVLNIDIADFYVEEKFNFIYSISTFEHMDSDGGRNEEWSSNKLVGEYSSVAGKNIKHVVLNLLEDNGRFVVTVPIGYLNCEIDKSIFEGEFNNLPVTLALTAYKRVGQLEWVQIPLWELHGFKENEKIRGRQALVVMDFKKNKH